MLKFSQKGFTPIMLFILVVGIFLGVYLVQNRTNFLPKASEDEERVEKAQGSNIRDIPEVPEFVANEILVKVKGIGSIYVAQAEVLEGVEGKRLIPTGLQSLDKVLQKAEAQSLVPLSVYDDTQIGEGRWYKVILKGEKPKQENPKGDIDKASGFYEKDTAVFRDGKGVPASLTDVVSGLKKIPEVIDIEPNYIAYLFATPNDPFYAQYQWNLRKINMPGAWDVVRGSDALIAVLDTGILAPYGYNDLRGEFPGVGNSGERGIDAQGRHKFSNGVDDDGNGKVDDFWGWDFLGNGSNRPEDVVFGHGTFVGGIIGAATNNRLGVSGVAGGVSMLPVKVCRLECESFSVASGIEYAVKTGAKVINMSLGNTYDSSLLREKVKYAWDRGVVVVASAGNMGHKGNPIIYPAAYPNVLSVGATDKNDQKAYFSSYGPWVLLAAPGEDIFSTSAVNYICERYMGNNNYCFASGTSFSAPLVSALAALILSKQPTWTNQQVKDRITSTARQMPGHESYWKYGIIDACKALDCDKAALVSPATNEPGACPDGVNACGYQDGPPPTRCYNNNWRYVENENSATYNSWCELQVKGDPWGGNRRFCYECITPKCSEVKGQCADSGGKNSGKNLSCKLSSFREDASYEKGGCNAKDTGQYPYCYTSCEEVLAPVVSPAP